MSWLRSSKKHIRIHFFPNPIHSTRTQSFPTTPIELTRPSENYRVSINLTPDLEHGGHNHPPPTQTQAQTTNHKPYLPPFLLILLHPLRLHQCRTPNHPFSTTTATTAATSILILFLLQRRQIQPQTKPSASAPTTSRQVPRRNPQEPRPVPPPLPCISPTRSILSRHDAAYLVPELYKRRSENSTIEASNKAGGGSRPPSFEAIRDSLRQFGLNRTTNSNNNNNQVRNRDPMSLRKFTDDLNLRPGGPNNVIGGTGEQRLPASVFGKEMGEKKERESPTMRTEFVRGYSYEELGGS